MVPPFVNQSIIQLKNTSLLYVVAVPDLMYTGSIVVSDTFRPLEVYTSVAAMYFAILYPLTLWGSRLEARVEPEVPAGVICVPSSRWGPSVNALTSDRLTDIGGGPTFYSCLVDVEKFEPELHAV